MLNNTSVLSIDDDIVNQEIVRAILENHYSTEILSSGGECLTFLENNTPEIILMDVSMPVMNGFETCKLIKQNNETKNIPILFISAHAEIEEKLKCYEVGGHDFLAKPFNDKELITKIKHLTETKRDNDNLKEQLSSAQAVAFDAMTRSSNIGTMFRFLQNALTCQNLNTLIQLIFETLKSLNLSCYLNIYSLGKVYSQCEDGKEKPLASSIIEKCRDKGRFVDINSVTIINYKHISLMIKDMPAYDQDKAITIKDDLNVLLSGTEEKIKSLESEQALYNEIEKNNQMHIQMKHLEQSEQILNAIQKTLDELDFKYTSLRRKGAGLMEDMQTDIREMLQNLLLEEYQEEKIIGVMDDYLRRSNRLFDSEFNLHDMLNKLMKLVKP